MTTEQDPRAALERIAGFTLSQFMGPHDMALECVNVARAALAAPAPTEQPADEPFTGIWADIDAKLKTMAPPATGGVDALTFEQWWDMHQKAARERLDGDDWFDLNDADKEQYRDCWEAARSVLSGSPALTDALTQVREVVKAWRNGAYAVQGPSPLRDIEAILAALSPAPEVAPVPELTSKQIEAGWHATFSTSNPYCPCNLKSFTKAVRWAERALSQGSDA